MKISIKTMLVTILITLISCDGLNQKNGNNLQLPDSVQDAINGPASNLSQDLTNTLSYMGNEERLAYDVYNELYKQWNIKQLTNIANNSEVKHIYAIQKLIQKYKINDDIDFTNIDLDPLGYINTPIKNMQKGTYDISKIQKLYDGLVSDGMKSDTDALKVGCTIEVVDITDLDSYINLAEQANANDLKVVFNFLRQGSYSHYWSFDKALKKKGITKGCCSWSELCHTEYPQK